MQVNSIYAKPNGNVGVIVAQAPLENLIFEGGGPKGLVYVGALEVLEDKGILQGVRNVGGSSAGAMTALAIGLGFDASTVREIVFEQNITDLTDLSPEQPSGVLALPKKAWQGLHNLFGKSVERGRGLYRGEKLRAWLRELVDRRVDDAHDLAKAGGQATMALWQEMHDKNGALTFAELRQFGTAFPQLGIRNMAFTGTNYTDKSLEIFSCFDTPDMPIDFAVRISVSLPWFFKTVRYNGKEYMDGGCLDNYPMTIFDAVHYRQQGCEKLFRGVDNQNLATLGFKVDSQEEIRSILWEGAKQDETGWWGSLVRGVKDSAEKWAVGVDVEAATRTSNQQTYGKYAQRTIQIPDLDYSTFNFDLTDQDKQKLATAGRDATSEWFGLYYDNAGIELELEDILELREYITSNEFSDAQHRFPQFF